MADDKVSGRELLRCVVEHSGYAVFEASDGAEAIRSARKLLPDLILLDLHMTILGGFDVLRELRTDKRFDDIPIVALTGSAMKGDCDRALAAGFSGYLARPVSIVKLRSEIARFLHPNDLANVV